MSFSDWTTAVGPKVQGTWNLHNNLPSDVDFFVLFSSYGGIVGQFGQANYAAANTFLDAFVQYRHKHGRPASVIDIGVMGEVGFVSQNPHLLNQFERTGMHILREQDLLDALALALERSKPSLDLTPPRQLHNIKAYCNHSQLILGLCNSIASSSQSNRVAWRRDSRMSIYHNLDKSGETSSETIDSESTHKRSLKTVLRPDIPDDDKPMIIADALAGAIAMFLIKDVAGIALDRPLAELGIDSLVAIEVRNWIRQQAGIDISVFSIVQSSSLLELAGQINLEIRSGL
jgi:hypothetical protein